MHVFYISNIFHFKLRIFLKQLPIYKVKTYVLYKITFGSKNGGKPLVCGRNDACTQFTLKWLCFMDIEIKNFYLDLFQRFTVGAFTRYVTFHKR